MKVKITETGEVKHLSIFDAKSVDYISDFIADGIGDFSFDEYSGEYGCDQATFAWWDKVCADNQALDDRIQWLISEYGDEVRKVVQGVGSVDLEGRAATVNQALDEAFVESR